MQKRGRRASALNETIAKVEENLEKAKGEQEINKIMISLTNEFRNSDDIINWNQVNKFIKYVETAQTAKILAEITALYIKDGKMATIASIRNWAARKNEFKQLTAIKALEELDADFYNRVGVRDILNIVESCIDSESKLVAKSAMEVLRKCHGVWQAYTERFVRARIKVCSPAFRSELKKIKFMDLELA